VIVALAGLGCVPVVALGLVHDLARAAVIRMKLPALPAAILALDTFKRRARAVAVAWGGPAALGAALMLAAMWVTAALDVSRPGGGRAAAVMGLHQGVVLGLVLLRLVWFERALALLPLPPRAEEQLTDEPGPPSTADRAARSDAPSGPTPDRGA
jgi:hypothetical protein